MAVSTGGTFLENSAAFGVQILAVLVDLLRGHEDGHQLVTAFADLAADLLESDPMTKGMERVYPGHCVLVDEV
jgi:hypothetical protein